MTRQEIIDLLKPIIIAEVLKIERHPNADRLLLVDVDLGQEESGQELEYGVRIVDGRKIKTVITGADNFKVGDLVPYLGLGHVIPGYLILKGEKITLEKRMLRGLESSAMILAEDEIGLSEDHTGILIVNELEGLRVKGLDMKIGSSFIDVVGDEVIEKIVKIVGNANPKEERDID